MIWDTSLSVSDMRLISLCEARSFTRLRFLIIAASWLVRALVFGIRVVVAL